MKELKRCTYTMRPDHIDLLEEISEKYALRSRSAALAFLIEEYRRLRKNELNRINLRDVTSVYADSDSISAAFKNGITSADMSTCMYDHAADILKGDNENG